MEKMMIDELRALLGEHDAHRVSLHMLAGQIETTTDDIHRTFADNGDRAFVFLGPKDKLSGTRSENMTDGTITYTLIVTIPKD